MGGRISVKSTPGKGSTFRVDVPFGLPKGPLPPPAPSGRQVDVSSLRGLCVLVAEDNAVNSAITTALLEDMGIKPLLATNGQEAVELYKKHHAAVDLILMDVQMPVMDGYTATKAIRRCGLPRAEAVPIIAMTAHALRGDDQKSLKAGMNAHLTKPINVAELAQTLVAFANGSPQKK